MGGFLDKTLLERIRSANDIVDVIGSYIPLKRAGVNWVALCPFHREKTPSFNVNPHRQIFHCFGCHKGGDVFRFVQDYESIGFMDAVRRLAERAKIPLTFDAGPGAEASRQLKDVLLEMHEHIARRWHNALTNEANGQAARDYLAKRGVSAEAIRLFRLGFAPDAWDDTVNWGQSRKYALAEVEKAGLIVHREDSDRYYDRFRGRLMFPICDEQGRVIAFSGRLLEADAKAAKYVNSPETPIFSKGRVFYGLDKSRRAVLDAGFAVVCEGQLDLIACYMAGVENVVAPQGTAFTADHARILKRYASEVVLCFDSDEAGQMAAVRSLDGLLESGLAIRVALVPAPHDPDSFIKDRGAEAFRTLISEAPGFFDFLLDRLCRRHGTESDRGRLAIVGGMADALEKTGSAVLVDTHAQRTAMRLGISPEAVRAEFRRMTRSAAGSRTVPGTEPQDQDFTQELSSDEFTLLQLLLKNDDLIEWAVEHLNTQWIANSVARSIVTTRLDFARSGSWRGIGDYLSSIDDMRVASLVTDVVARNYREGLGQSGLDRAQLDHIRGRVIPAPLEDLVGILTRLRNKDIEKQITAIEMQRSHPSVNPEMQDELTRQLLALQATKRQRLGTG